MGSCFNHRGIQLLIINCSLLIISACSVEKQIARSAKADVLDAPPLQTAHVGISIFNPATNKYLYNYQGDKYFVPASNIKIPTCYAAMKYLGDSLTGAMVFENDTAIVIAPAGDPTLLHPDFFTNPVITFLRESRKRVFITDTNWNEEGLGAGWSWNDYNENYMAERSPLPVYGNVINWIQEIDDTTKPPFIYSIPEISWPVNFSAGEGSDKFSVTRELGSNVFLLKEGKEKKKEESIPFITNGFQSSIELLKDTIDKEVTLISPTHVLYRGHGLPNSLKRIYSQPTDSLLKPMMHRSDNFFAEQSLLMVSNEKLGVMNDERIIDTLLKTDFKDLPQPPRWVDGSGLSRYNLFTPQDLVFILSKMKSEFGMERLKVILPTGGEGTISNYYKADSGYIYGKTGTLSGVVAFSGFLYTKKGKLLIFSTLINNHRAGATEVRRAIEKFIRRIRSDY